jgi:hypothetical protein
MFLENANPIHMEYAMQALSLEEEEERKANPKLRFLKMLFLNHTG